MPDRRLIAACFDLDGTLIDTSPLHVVAERQALASLGVAELSDQHPFVFGMGIVPGMQALSDHYGLESGEAVLNAYLPFWDEQLATGVQLMPGAGELLSELAERRIPMALVTSGEADYARLVLGTLELEDAFAAVVTCDDVTEMKPSPEPYATAAELLGTTPDRCAAFEDSAIGVASVINSGAYCVAVHAEALSRSDLSSAHERFASLADISDGVLDRLFGQE